jgi:hypothetical protein
MVLANKLHQLAAERHQKLQRYVAKQREYASHYYVAAENLLITELQALAQQVEALETQVRYQPVPPSPTAKALPVNARYGGLRASNKDEREQIRSLRMLEVLHTWPELFDRDPNATP